MGRVSLLGGVLVLGVLTCTASTVLAQDKGKTEAAELAADSKVALEKLYATVPLAKRLGPAAHAVGVSQGHQGGLRHRGPVR